MIAPRHLKSPLTIVATAIVLATGLAAYLLLSSTSDASSGSVAAALTEHFAALSDASTSDTAVAEAAGLASSTPHSVATSDSAVKQWVAANGQELCVIAADAAVNGGISTPSYACAPIAGKVETELLIMGSGGSSGESPFSKTASAPTSTLITGIAPNGVTSVTITYANGHSESVPVAENGFHALSPAGVHPKSYTWTGPNGVEHSQG